MRMLSAAASAVVLVLARPARAETAYAIEPEARSERARAAPRATNGDVRLALGPALLTSVDASGAGLGAALDLGHGTVGARFAGVWVRSLGGGGHATESMALTTAEVTVDANPGGRLHPVVGVGTGLAFVSRSATGGVIGVGVARAALDWQLAPVDADVRAGLDVTGAIAGPAERDVRDVRAFAMLGAHLVIGF